VEEKEMREKALFKPDENRRWQDRRMRQDRRMPAAQKPLLAAHAEYCGRLNMLLTHEACMELRNRAEPPVPCAGCQGELVERRMHDRRVHDRRTQTRSKGGEPPLAIEKLHDISDFKEAIRQGTSFLTIMKGALIVAIVGAFVLVAMKVL
jgi:hypothetical protein